MNGSTSDWMEASFLRLYFLTKMELKGVFLVLATVRDSTERKKRELALQESEHRYRQLFSKIADAIFVADVESKMLVDCNKKAELLTEYSREEILSMRADQLHPEETRSDVMKVFLEQAGGNTEKRVESVVVSKTGKDYSCYHIGRPGNYWYEAISYWRF